jgi:hypothetical protein
MPGRSGIPERKVGHPVGVDVFGRPFKFGERGDGRPGFFGELVVDLEQNGFVGLNDEGTVHQLPLRSFKMARRRWPRSGTSPAQWPALNATVVADVRGQAVSFAGQRIADGGILNARCHDQLLRAEGAETGVAAMSEARCDDHSADPPMAGYASYDES